ncbi:hypothetical protein GCM10010472_52110 [Pseudonocardia halophobica]|uniref:Uncharacterized protein n=1 Tax=Pseudonocardia halophobica TaxID=29401 RepID=A0A9W6L1U3_9PSEU|nr:hypothetical protein [Pseudonocardia halophobica]GLL11347.1 hypothetical protein GCM10017577_24880 [Pseudonocardia halophobica]
MPKQQNGGQQLSLDLAHIRADRRNHLWRRAPEFTEKVFHGRHVTATVEEMPLQSGLELNSLLLGRIRFPAITSKLHVQRCIYEARLIDAFPDTERVDVPEPTSGNSCHVKALLCDDGDVLLRSAGSDSTAVPAPAG